MRHAKQSKNIYSLGIGPSECMRLQNCKKRGGHNYNVVYLVKFCTVTLQTWGHLNTTKNCKFLLFLKENILSLYLIFFHKIFFPTKITVQLISNVFFS